jgi:hypothetical protein
MKLLSLLALAMLVLALSAGIYVMWLNLPIGSKTYIPYSANLSNYFTENQNVSAYNQIVQFYPNMRYPDRVVSYRIEYACSEEKVNNIKKAFEILSEKTILRFNETTENPEISILCSNIAPTSQEKGHFIAGEGGPSEIINTTNFAVILSGKVSLYRENKCDEPKVAIHEVLHALGFDHYNNTKSILYPITSCDQQIDPGIIEMINKLYSVNSLPDLAIESIEASREGRYLNFDINISNAGLIHSKEAELNLFFENEKITNFSVGSLDVGEKKILSVQNLRLPSRADRITFIVESNESELSLTNNKAEIYAV